MTGMEKFERFAKAASQERVLSRSALGGIVVNNVGVGKVRRIAALEAAQTPGCVSSLGVKSDRVQIARLRADLLILDVELAHRRTGVDEVG
jgi:hypothetical protein